jgi:hypothetical protein
MIRLYHNLSNGIIIPNFVIPRRNIISTDLSIIVYFNQTIAVNYIIIYTIYFNLKRLGSAAINVFSMVVVSWVFVCLYLKLPPCRPAFLIYTLRFPASLQLISNLFLKYLVYLFQRFNRYNCKYNSP